MKLDDIQSYIDENRQVTDDISYEAKKIPIIHGKLLAMRSTEFLTLKSLQLDLKKVTFQRWLFYSGKAETKQYKEENFDLKVLRGDINIFLEADDNIQTIQSKIAVQEAKLEVLNEAVKAINTRQFLLKNMLEYQRMIAGIN